VKDRGSDRAAKTVQVGLAEACISQVTVDQLIYKDSRGERHSVSLRECRDSWYARFMQGRRVRGWDRQQNRVVTKPTPPIAETTYVGNRDLTGRPPWVAIAAEPEVRFEFSSPRQAYEELLEPLGAAGWRTFDYG
jgi:hypothetical protein